MILISDRAQAPTVSWCTRFFNLHSNQNAAWAAHLFVRNSSWHRVFVSRRFHVTLNAARSQIKIFNFERAQASTVSWVHLGLCLLEPERSMSTWFRYDATTPSTVYLFLGGCVLRSTQKATRLTSFSSCVDIELAFLDTVGDKLACRIGSQCFYPCCRKQKISSNSTRSEAAPGNPIQCQVLTPKRPKKAIVA